MIEYPLERLQDSVGRFAAPSTVLSDIRALSFQIELRRRALKDIGIISCRLRLWGGRKAVGQPRLKKSSPARQHLMLRRGRSLTGSAHMPSLMGLEQFPRGD